jgi:uncharacterized RDD family membrane protein YckC
VGDRRRPASAGGRRLDVAVAAPAREPVNEQFTSAQPQPEPTPFAQQPQAGYGTASGPRAGFWQRFAAAFLDALILFIPQLIVARIFSGFALEASILLAGAYFTYFVGAARGQTPGQSALGLRVIGFEDGAPIGHGRAFVRWIGSFLSAFCFLLGYLWMLWDREKQCWHDKFARDVVVPVSAYPPPH